MNHSVHSFINGCLTLKFSESWKTVTESLLVFAVSAAVLELSSEAMAESVFDLSGEMGMVSRGTGELGLIVVGTVSTVAILRRGRRGREMGERRSVVRLR